VSSTANSGSKTYTRRSAKAPPCSVLFSVTHTRLDEPSAEARIHAV
jgi:hypothetical protein